MIQRIKFEEFKSINETTIDFGRVTVLIGANNSGKTNLLEGIAFAGAIADHKEDIESLTQRGIRAAHNRRMLVARFGNEEEEVGAGFQVKGSESPLYHLYYFQFFEGDVEEYHSGFKPSPLLPSKDAAPGSPDYRRYESECARIYTRDLETLKRFRVYAPENREMRNPSGTMPLGNFGTGLHAWLNAIANQDDTGERKLLWEALESLGRFDDLLTGYGDGHLIEDGSRRHIPDRLAALDLELAGDGLLQVLFVLALTLDVNAPPFFSVDNFGASLDIKTSENVLPILSELAKKLDKQIILTTHNPSILDGLNLHDDEQRLYSVRRNNNGETKANRIEAPRVAEGQMPVRLSEAYLRGYLGGLS